MCFIRFGFSVMCVLMLAVCLASSGPIESSRKWFEFPFRLPPPPPQIEQFFIQTTKHAKNFIDNLVPKPIRDFLDGTGRQTPDWVPEERHFDEQEDDGFQADEPRSEVTKGNVWIERKQNKSEEMGNLRGFGRDVIRQISYQFSNISSGLDTNKTFFSGLMAGFKEHVRAIYPGTQWCGDGNRASNDEELGHFFKTDSCCRDHDSCVNFIGKDEMKHGLFNKGLFSRSHCECDDQFYDCLKEADDMISAQIGTAYFTVLGPQCFRREYPIVDCKIRLGLTNRCIEYELNNSTKKVYQWFDNREF